MTLAVSLANLIPTEAPGAGQTPVVKTASPLDMDWASASGGAFVPPATAQSQHLISGAGPGFAWGLETALPQAPSDGALYGMASGAWVKAVPLAGGTMTGRLTLSGAPSAANDATTKTYVDAADALPVDCGTF